MGVTEGVKEEEPDKLGVALGVLVAEGEKAGVKVRVRVPCADTVGVNDAAGDVVVEEEGVAAQL